jgi:hypothetical protein
MRERESLEDEAAMEELDVLMKEMGWHVHYDPGTDTLTVHDYDCGVSGAPPG